MTDYEFQSYDEMAEEGERLERALETWIEDHGPTSKKPWPADQVEIKERRLSWARKIIELLRRAAEKQRGAA